MNRSGSLTRLYNATAVTETSLVSPSGDNGAGSSARKLYVASDRQLRRKSHFQRLAIATAALDVPRRELVNVIGDKLYSSEGQMLWPDDTPFALPDIDDVFGGDGSFRWVSDFIHFALTPPRQLPQKRILDRLRVIDLYFRQEHEERARWIAE